MLRLVAISGFTLIEMLVTISLAVIMLLLAQAGFSSWIATSKSRSVAEALQNGVRAAQGEALKRNRQVAFVLTNVNPVAGASAMPNGSNWYIQALPLFPGEVVDAPLVSVGSFGNVGAGVSVKGTAAICFNSMARLVTNAATSSIFGAACVAMSSVLYTVTVPGASRTYQVQISMGGQVRLCDANKVLSAAAPDGC